MIAVRKLTQSKLLEHRSKLELSTFCRISDGIWSSFNPEVFSEIMPSTAFASYIYKFRKQLSFNLAILICN